MLVSSVSGPRFPGANACAYTHRCCAPTFSTRPTMSTISIQPAPGLSHLTTPTATPITCIVRFSYPVIELAVPKLSAPGLSEGPWRDPTPIPHAPPLS